MPDSATSRDNSPAKPPLTAKADKRAQAKAARARALRAQQRHRAWTVGGAAVVVLALVVALVVWIGRSSPSQPDPGSALSAKPAVTAGAGTLSALKVTTLVQGTGAAVQTGQSITVNYVGVSYADGKEFDSSWSRSQPFTFQAGVGNVIKGWDQGLIGVPVGSRVQVDIPSELAYGDNPTGGQPAGALRFVVDVLSAS